MRDVSIPKILRVAASNGWRIEVHRYAYRSTKLRYRTKRMVKRGLLRMVKREGLFFVFEVTPQGQYQHSRHQQQARRMAV